MRATESFVLANDTTGDFTGAFAAGADPNTLNEVPAVAVSGGRYTILASGSLGSSPAVQIGDRFGNWYTVSNSLTAGTPQIVEIPAGTARASLTGASGTYVTLSRIPG